MNDFRFRIVNKDQKTNARVGEIQTPHGTIETPAFVPVGTQGSVKSLTPEELETLGVDLFIVNTYHMYLRPGIEVIKKFGGLHKFIGWDEPLITDSGGFQVFSLNGRKGALVADENLDPSSISGRVIHNSDSVKKVKTDKISSAPRANSSLVKITEDGVEFQSHWDGTKHMFTPESSMEHQWNLGSDIHIAFDDCTPYPATHEQAKTSMERTHRWATRSMEEHKRLCHSERSTAGRDGVEESLANTSSNELRPACRQGRDPLTALGMTVNYQALYGVVQGSTFEDLRKESARTIAEMDFDGIAIGGVSVGESKKEMVNVLDWTVPLLPNDKPRHLLGVGEIDDIFELVERGIDTFDCVQPTRLARMGRLLARNHKSQIPMTKQHEIDITNKMFAKDAGPVESGCQCYTCRNFSRAYLHHLFRVRELLAYRLATIHNIYFINTLMNTIRKSIVDNTFLELKEQWIYNNFKL